MTVRCCATGKPDECAHGYCLEHSNRCALCRWQRDQSSRPKPLAQQAEDLTDACLHGEPRGSRYCALCRRPGRSGEGEAWTPTPPANLEWEQRAKHAIWDLACTGKPFTSEDVTDRAGFPDPFGHRANGPNNQVGILILKVAKTYSLRRVNMTKARNPQSHGRLLTVWQGRTR